MPRDEVLRRLRDHWSEIRAFDVASLRLFGSVARDTAGEASDVDLLVGFGQPPTFSRYMKLRIFLEDLLGSNVDLVTETGLKERARGVVEEDTVRVA